MARSRPEKGEAPADPSPHLAAHLHRQPIVALHLDAAEGDADNAARDRLHADLLQIWTRLLETDQLSLDDDFFDKGGDSLLATELMLELRRLTGKDVPETVLFEAATIRALAERLSDSEIPRLKLAVRIGARLNDETPLMFFHGDWGGGFYVEHFARRLAPELPLVAIAPHGMSDEPIPASFAAMAGERLAAILEVQPTGPYRLGGHCAGAMVALETGRLLLALGHQVEIIVLVDPPPVADDAYRGPLYEQLTVGVTQAYADCMVGYAPEPLAAPIVLFLSAYGREPWCRLGSSCEVFEGAGGHFDWITIHADDFASHLKDYLRRRQTVAASTIADRTND